MADFLHLMLFMFSGRDTAKDASLGQFNAANCKNQILSTCCFCPELPMYHKHKISDVTKLEMWRQLKGEDDIKSFLEGRLKSLPDQLMKNSNLNKLNEIYSTVSALPEQFEARLLKLQNDICRVFTREMEVDICNMFYSISIILFHPTKYNFVQLTLKN